MTPQQFEAIFENVKTQISLPAQLRGFVWDLAVQGKLTPTQTRGRKPIEGRNGQFLIPEYWETLLFSRDCDIQGGNQPPKSNFIDSPQPGYTRLIQIRDLGSNPIPVYIPTDTTNRFCSPGEILIGRYGASIGKVFWAFEGAYNVALTKFITNWDKCLPEFAFVLLRSFIFQDVVRNASRTAQAGFNKNDLGNIVFPLPPLEEQKRIVAKVDELMALCDKLEDTRDTELKLQSQFISSTNSKLVSGEQIQRETLDYATKLQLSKYSEIKKFKRAVLELAFCGRLIAQNDQDGNVNSLIEKIDGHKKSIVKLSENIEPEFSIPRSWRWVPALFPATSISTKGKQVPTKQISDTGNFPVIDQGKVFIRGYSDISEKVINVEKPILVFGDHTREVKLIDFDFIVGADGTKLLEPIEIDPRFYYFALTWLPIESRGYGRHFKLLKDAYIPLPPLDEQRRISSSLDRILSTIEELAAGLSKKNIIQTNLLKTLVA